MNELIKITENNGTQAVSARELHKFLEVTERFSYWFERQLPYGFTEGADYVGCKEFNTLANQELTDYALTLDCAKEISMIQRSERGKQAREYFIACEKKSKSIEGISRKDLAKMLIESEEEKERLQLISETQAKELVLQAPKVDYYNKCLESKGYMTVNVIAAELGISAVKLNRLLCNWGIQYWQTDCYVLYTDYRNKNYTVHRPYPHINSQGETVTTQHMYWTETGKKFIVELYHKRNAA